jgi:hypothetical protein
MRRFGADYDGARTDLPKSEPEGTGGRFAAA